jgi:hypothetical protein
MNTIKKSSQTIRHIAIANMEPESGYQRATNPAQVDTIVNTFTEAKLGTLTVSERDGKFHVMDGAHRLKALRMLGYTHAYCVVNTGMTYEQEAEYFRNQDENKRRIKPMEFFKAGLVSGNEQCTSIYGIVKANGFNIGSGSKDFHKIAAIQALFAIVDDYGYQVLDETLCLLAATWSGSRKASQSETLLGVAEFVSRYGMADFAERMQEKYSAVFYDYTEAARVRGTVSSTTIRKKFCRAIVEHYNKGLSSNSRKRLKWEG